MAQLTDAVFVLSDGSRFPAHRLVLAVGSPVFKAAFYGALPHGAGEDIPVPDVEAGAFRALVRWLYTDHVEIDRDSVTPLLYAAKKYQVEDVERLCLNYLQQNLDTASALDVLNHAVFFDADELKADCLKLIVNDAPAQLASEDWPRLSLEALCVMLREDTLALPETAILAAVRRWAQAKCREKEVEETPANEAAVLGQALGFVRFPLMSADELNSLATDGLLTMEEKLRFLCRINDKEAIGDFTAERRRNPAIIPRLREMGLQGRDDEFCGDIAKLLSLEAALEGDLKALEASLDAGLPVARLRTKTGQLFRDKVLAEGSVEAARLLAKNGVDFKPALCNASSSGHLAMVRLLLDAGADVDAEGYLGFTPLHYASLNGRSAVARALLEAGANVNAVDKGGETPLHKAAWRGRLDVARLLLERGADRTVRNKEGETPLEQARRFYQPEAARLLESWE